MYYPVCDASQTKKQNNQSVFTLLYSVFLQNVLILIHLIVIGTNSQICNLSYRLWILMYIAIILLSHSLRYFSNVSENHRTVGYIEFLEMENLATIIKSGSNVCTKIQMWRC